jgi:hypothetical protein
MAQKEEVIEMSEVLKVKCRDCDKICNCVPFCDEQIADSYTKKDKRMIEYWEKLLLMEWYLVYCQMEHRLLFVKQ